MSNDTNIWDLRPGHPKGTSEIYTIYVFTSYTNLYMYKYNTFQSYPVPLHPIFISAHAPSASPSL